MAKRICVVRTMGSPPQDPLDLERLAFARRNYELAKDADTQIGFLIPCDGIMMSDLSPALTRTAVGAVHGHLREFGRDPAAFQFNNFMAWYVYDDLQEARHEAKRWIGFRAIFREYMMREFVSAEDFALILKYIPQIYAMAARNAHTVEGVPDRLLDMCVDHLTLTGAVNDMDHVIAHLQALKEAGCTQVSLELKKHQAHGIRLIGERVIPALR